MTPQLSFTRWLRRTNYFLRAEMREQEVTALTPGVGTMYQRGEAPARAARTIKLNRDANLALVKRVVDKLEGEA